MFSFLALRPHHRLEAVYATFDDAIANHLVSSRYN